MKYTILIVDDEPQIVQTIADYFPEFTILTAGNGEEGLRAMDESMPDLIVTDIIMPDMEGIEFIQQATQRYPSIPVVAMSGSPLGQKYLEDAIRFGAIEKIQKPFDLEELEAIINKLLDNKAENE